MICDIDPAANAFWIANQMEQKRYEYELTPDELVIDLGAYQGEFSRLIHDRYGCQVIAVEMTEAANSLIHCPWCTLIKKAASIDYLPLKFGGNSYYTTHMEPGNQVYDCFDIMDLMHQSIGLLKINVEGMEWAIMRRILDMNAAKYVKYLQIQFHKLNEMSDAAYMLIHDELTKTHSLMWRVPYVWESWKRND